MSFLHFKRTAWQECLTNIRNFLSPLQVVSVEGGPGRMSLAGLCTPGEIPIPAT